MRHTYGSYCELEAASRIYSHVFEVYRDGVLYVKCGVNGHPIVRLRFTSSLSSGHFDAYIPTSTDVEFEELPDSPIIQEKKSKRRSRFDSSGKKKSNKNRRINNDTETAFVPIYSSLPWKVKAFSGIHYNPAINYEQDKSIDIGLMENKCMYCNALTWKDECASLCCCSGKVQLPPFQKLPEPLYSLIFDLHPDHCHFMERIRKYNGCFQMTSFGAKRIIEDGFMPTFKIQGQVYHIIGSVLPVENEIPKFLQIYFVGEDEKEVNIRVHNHPGVKRGLVKQTMFHKNNSYVKDMKTAMENISDNYANYQVVIHADKKPTGSHEGRYNAPTTNEVAMVLVGQQSDQRDIIIQCRDSKTLRISELHRSYDALQYPILFCRGEDGYAINIPLRDPDTKLPLNKTVSALNFYGYRLMLRQGEINHLLCCRALLSQWMVDMYAKI